MEAGKRDVTAIFNRARTLEIPFFQRAYVWEEESWERFVDDLISAPLRTTGYFLGSIILKQKPVGTGSRIGDVRVVVDGQQRLTSLVLFFRVLCDELEKFQFFDDVFTNLAGDLTLQHNHNDIEVFEALASGQGVNNALEERYADNRVLGAWRYFRSRRKEIAQVEPMTLLSRLYFVGIDLGAEEDEQQIFDTINSLGVELTAAELLKNHLFDRKDLPLFEETWKTSFEASETQKQYWGRNVTSGRQRRQNIDLFLQAHLLSEDDGPSDFRVGDLFQGYKDFLEESEVERPQFARRLTLSADRYGERVDPSLLEQGIDGDDAHERFNIVVFGLQTTTVLPFYLRILRSVENSEEQSRMVRLLESYLLRRMVAGESPKNYNNFFASLARGGVDSYAELLARFLESDDPSSRFPKDDAVRRGFQETNLTNRQARVVLYLLEASIRDSSRHSTALAGFKHYTLEHVMPKKWRNHWPSIPEEQAEERDQVLRKLGNLTLLSSKLNTSIRDSDWDRKKEGSKARAGLKRYGAGLEIFDQDLREDVWDEARIRARGLRLAEQAIGSDVWPAIR
jgi:hypothetical protein